MIKNRGKKLLTIENLFENCRNFFSTHEKHLNFHRIIYILCGKSVENFKLEFCIILKLQMILVCKSKTTYNCKCNRNMQTVIPKLKCPINYSFKKRKTINFPNTTVGHVIKNGGKTQ